MLTSVSLQDMASPENRVTVRPEPHISPFEDDLYLDNGTLSILGQGVENH